jgi:hypothetical protein
VRDGRFAFGQWSGRMSAAIMGTFVSIKTMADGSPRITLDMQCTLSEVAAMGLIPGVPFALARLIKEAAGKPTVAPVSQPQKPSERAGQLCVMACTFCADGSFWKWLEVDADILCDSEKRAKEYILDMCGIESRKELDANNTAAACFHEFIRMPFLAWKAAA